MRFQPQAKAAGDTGMQSSKEPKPRLLLFRSARTFLGRIAGFISAVQVYLIRYLIPMHDRAAGGDYASILIIKLDELGDVAMMLPLLAALKHSKPDAKVTVVVNSQTSDLLAGMKGIQLLSVDVTCHHLLRPLVLPIRHYRFAKRHFDRQSFDLCLLPRRDADDVYATFLAYFSRASRRIGFSEKSTPRKAERNRCYDRLLTDVFDATAVEHETTCNLRLLDYAGISSAKLAPLQCYLPESVFSNAESALSESRLPYIAICPSSGHSELKQWGADRFAEVAGTLTSAGYPIVLLGGKNDVELGARIESAVTGTCINLTGKTSLPEVLAILNRCRVFLGNDAGLIHLASALGIPAVGVFGSSCHHRFGPWGEGHSVLVREISCSPCRSHLVNRCQACIYQENLCLRQISAGEASDAVLSAVSRNAVGLPHRGTVCLELRRDDEHGTYSESDSN